MGILDFLRRPEPEQAVEVELRRSSVPAVKRNAPRPRNSGRNYVAAQDKPYFGAFNASSGSADYDLSVGIAQMRNKIRAMMRNSGTGKRYQQLLKDNVVGEAGFTLRSRVRLTTDPKRMDKGLNKRVEEAWKRFCENPTVNGVMDMIEVEKQMVATHGRDGEHWIELVEGSQYPDGIALNPFEADLVDETLNTIYPQTGNQIRMGVEVDGNGKPVAYHVLTTHPGDLVWSIPRTNRRYRRVPARNIIHVFERLRPGQTRGEPPASSVVNNVKMLDGYREAEVTGRRVKAAAMGVVIDKDGMSDDRGIDEMADTVDEVDGEFEMYMEPGTFQQLPRGKDFKQFDPGGAMSDYAQFEGQIKTDASQGVSISPVSLGYETSKLSYSTHRGVIAEDRDMYRGLQSFHIRMGMKPIFIRWLISHVSFNIESEIPPSRLLTIISNFRFQPRGWDYIDPSKDVSADNEQLKARTTSLSRVAAKRGISFEDLVQEIAEDEAMLKEYGLTQTFGDDNSVNTTSSDDDEDSDDESSTQT